MYFKTYGVQQKSELKKDADAGCRRVLCASCHWIERMKQDGTQAVKTWSGKHIIKKTLRDGTASVTGSEGTTRSIFDLELMVFPIVQRPTTRAAAAASSKRSKREARSAGRAAAC